MSISRAGASVAAVVLATVLLAPHFAGGCHGLWYLDSGNYIYEGQQWLLGGRLYVDVWDHKPPLVIVANAVGLWLGGGKAAGVGVVAWAAAAGFALFFLTVAGRRFGLIPSLTALASVFLWLSRWASPNSVELFALPLNMLLMWMLLREAEGSRFGRHLVAAGAASAALFFFRANLCASGALYLVATVIRTPWRAWFGVLSRFLGGVALFSAPLLVLVHFRGSLSEMWDAAITFNFTYMSVKSPFAKLIYPFFAFENFGETGLMVLALAAGCWGILMWVRGDHAAPPVLRWGSLVLLTEIAAGAVSGRFYSHYLVPAVPAAGLLTAWFLDQVLGGREDADARNPTTSVAPAHPLVAALCTAAVLVFVLDGLHKFRQAMAVERAEPILAARLRPLLAPTDRVYVWTGWHVSPHFVLGQPSASRYFTTIFLLHDVKTYRALMPRLVTDLERNRPKLVVDCGTDQIAYLFPVSRDHGATRDDLFRFWTPPDIEQRLRQLSLAYEYSFVDSATGCVVYSRR